MLSEWREYYRQMFNLSFHFLMCNILQVNRIDLYTVVEKNNQKMLVAY